MNRRTVFVHICTSHKPGSKIFPNCNTLWKTATHTLLVVAGESIRPAESHSQKVCAGLLLITQRTPLLFTN